MHEMPPFRKDLQVDRSLVSLSRFSPSAYIARSFSTASVFYSRSFSPRLRLYREEKEEEGKHPFRCKGVDEATSKRTYPCHPIPKPLSPSPSIHTVGLLSDLSGNIAPQVVTARIVSLRYTPPFSPLPPFLVAAFPPFPSFPSFVSSIGGSSTSTEPRLSYDIPYRLFMEGCYCCHFLFSFPSFYFPPPPHPFITSTNFISLQLFFFHFLSTQPVTLVPTS